MGYVFITIWYTNNIILYIFTDYINIWNTIGITYGSKMVTGGKGHDKCVEKIGCYNIISALPKYKLRNAYNKMLLCLRCNERY